MPIGMVPDDEFEKELERLKGGIKAPPRPSVTGTIIDIPSKGRNEGDVNVPDSLRKIIGEEAVISGRASALALAKDMGISPSSVSAYANGATSTTTYNESKPSIIQHINKSRARASKKASRVLVGALDAITQEKLDYTDAKDLAAIAKNMSAVIKDLEPPAESTKVEEGKAPQFVIFAPQFRSEQSFETIVVNE